MKVVALVDDLMDRSRVSAAAPDVEFIRDIAATAPADIVVVDLACYPEAIGEIRRVMPQSRIIAFGPHVEDAALTAARADGADLVLPRSQFFRDPATALGQTLP